MSADSRHDRSDVASVAQTISYPAAMLNDATDNGFGDPDELPETWVIDRGGIVRAEFNPAGQLPVGLPHDGHAVGRGQLQVRLHQERRPRVAV